MAFNRMEPLEKIVSKTVEMARRSAGWAVPLALKRMEILESLALLKWVEQKDIDNFFGLQKDKETLFWLKRESSYDPEFRQRALAFIRKEKPFVENLMRRDR